MKLLALTIFILTHSLIVLAQTISTPIQSELQSKKERLSIGYIMDCRKRNDEKKTTYLYNVMNTPLMTDARDEELGLILYHDASFSIEAIVTRESDTIKKSLFGSLVDVRMFTNEKNERVADIIANKSTMNRLRSSYKKNSLYNTIQEGDVIMQVTLRKENGELVFYNTSSRPVIGIQEQDILICR